MIEKSDYLPFTAVISKTGGSLRITIPVGVRKALGLEAGDILETMVRKVMRKPIVVDNRIIG